VFDPLDFSVKDLRMRCVIICCNSSGNLYTIPPATTATSHHTHILMIVPLLCALWHTHLGHPDPAVLNKLQSLGFSFSLIKYMLLFVLLVNLVKMCAHRLCHHLVVPLVPLI
jgi:hypothetical protein